MVLSVLMLLIVSGTQGSHYLGTVVTYYTKETFTDGSVSVIVRFKYNFISCDYGTFQCTGNCGDESLVGKKSEVQKTERWCQTEQITSQLLPNNSPFQLVYNRANWFDNVNGMKSWRAVAEVELRNRSDTKKPNSSPQTTILPDLRVPSNCLRNINLLAFDPDEDEVRCRYADLSMTECASPCTPPPVLSLSSNCTFSFNASSNDRKGLYAVQMVMEDFPRQQITLTQANGSQVVKTTSDAISGIPIQFGIQVDPVAPSCSEGDYLPRFLPPTPEHGARFYCNVNQTLEIKISGIANQTGTLELLFSGPHNVVKTSSGSGNFYLKWTPSIIDEGPGHPICFVIQNRRRSVYQSELRCVVVTVKRDPVVLKLTIWTTLSLEENKDNILKTVREELVKLGLPAHVPVRLKGDDQAEESGSASP